MPLVSVVMPLYNTEDYVINAVKSVLSQYMKSFEILIVDDCSGDLSAKIIESLVKQDSRINLIKLPVNMGVSNARNKAIEVSKGRYIAFLDSDDIWLPDKLEKQLAFMQENNYPFTYAAYDKINEHGQLFGHVGVSDKVSYTDLLKTNSIGCLTAMYDTQYFGKVYMPRNTKREDFATWLQLLKKVDYAYGVNETLAQYRVYSSQNSAKKIKMAKESWHLYRDIEGLSLIKASYYFSHYAVRGLLRTKVPGLAKMLGVLK